MAAGAVRQPINQESLERYLNRVAPQIETPIVIGQFGDGQSNPTYKLTARNGQAYVLRKQPPGALVSSKNQHRVDREYQIINAMQGTKVPVPKVIHLCEDPSIIGTSFYVMEFLDGRIILDSFLTDYSQEERTAMWLDAARVLAEFHSVDPASVGLASFGRSSGFYNRQLKTFKALEAQQALIKHHITGVPIGPVPHLDEMLEYYTHHQPPDRSTFVHGDYRIGNLMWHKTEPRIIGVLDWEMATIGHPSSDVASLLDPFSRWKFPHPTLKSGPFGPASWEKMRQIPPMETLIKTYSDIAGWDPLPDLWWATSFQSFKGAVISQGIAARVAANQHAGGSSAQMYVDRYKPDADRVLGMIKYLKSVEKSKL